MESPVEAKRTKKQERFTTTQITGLEEYFKKCSHPNHSQRKQISEELGLDHIQIKFWFQNKRTKEKRKMEQASIAALHEENESLKLENHTLKQALYTSIFHAYSLNATSNEPMGESQNWQRNEQFIFSKMEKAIMMEAAENSVKELMTLMEDSDELWVKSNSKLGINEDVYMHRFPRRNLLNKLNFVSESSKASGVVQINAHMLVDIILDPVNFVTCFPTLVKDAKTLLVLHGSSEHKHAYLQLMYKKMHALCPLIPCREFYLLRYCTQLEDDKWLISDTSCNFITKPHSSSAAWKLPSGCLIKDMFNGLSRVTWIEHVETYDERQMDPHHYNLIRKIQPYGANRWIAFLQRICNRNFYHYKEIISDKGNESVICSINKRSTMELAHTMMSSFWETLKENDEKPTFEGRDTIICIKNDPKTSTISAIATCCLPANSACVYNCFADNPTLFQSMILCNANSTVEIARLETGLNQRNFVSLFRVILETENSGMVLQECFTDTKCSFIVCCAIDDTTALNVVVKGDSSINISMVPAGLMIYGDDCAVGERLSTSCFVSVVLKVSLLNSSSIEANTSANFNNYLASIVRKLKDMFGKSC